MIPKRHSHRTGESIGSCSKVDGERSPIEDAQLLYCGGSKPVLDDLKKYQHKFGIKLAVEKFDW